jgi:Secretion system C-terminal sorting domain
MQLISTFCIKKAMAAGLLMMMMTFTYAGNNAPPDTRRVFWNKFEVIETIGNTILLTWNVTEYNNRSFIVQHSINGTEWEDIALVQSKNSAESMTDYSYKHTNKLVGKQFYRLKDIDVDYGTTGFSPVKTLILKNEKQVVTIWPNPVTNYILISNDNINLYTKARVFDLTGKMMIERKLDPDVTEIPVTELPAGTYIVKIENNKGVAYTQKIVKQ